MASSAPREAVDTGPPDRGYRHYQTARLRAGVFCLYGYLVAGLAACVLITATDTGTFPLALAVSCAGVVVAGVWWGERVIIKTGLEECPHGFIDRRNFGSRVLMFADIERFDHRKVLSVDRVFAVRADNGRGDPIQGLVQGRRVVWEGGETHDIVGVLNERLRARLSVLEGR